MVSIDEIVEEVPPSEERRLDAEAIEKAAQSTERPTARMHLEALAKKLRRESEALKRVEKSKMQVEEAEEKKVDSEATATSDEAVDATTTAAPVAPAPVAAAPTPAAASTDTGPPPPVPKSVKYTPIDRFSFDAGGYNAPFVTVYAPLPGVGSIERSQIKCDFTVSSFDLVVHDLKSKSYRLFKDNLEKDIDPKKSKIVVKADKVLVKLAKVKQGDYGGYEYWSELTDTKKIRKAGSSRAKDDPQASIMDMMKDIYDKGDDQMKKMIGETMMKQQRGELGKDGGFGGADDFAGL